MSRIQHRKIKICKPIFTISVLFMVLLMVCGLASQAVLAQNVYKTEELLLVNSAQWEAFESSYNELTGTEIGMPLVQKMEFRTESNSNSIKEQEFLFRTSFNRIKSIKTQENIDELELQIFDHKIQSRKNLVFATRFDLVVSLWALDRQLSILSSKKMLMNDKSTIYQRKLVANASLDIEDLLKVDKEIRELKRAEIGINLEKRDLLQQLLGSRRSEDELFQVDTSDWIGEELMFEIVDELTQRNQAADLLLENKYKIEMAEWEIEKKQLDENRIFDFAQVKYAQRNNRAFANEWSLGLGLTLPHKASADYKKYGAQVELVKEKYKLQEKQVLLADQLDQALALFQRLKANYDLLKEEQQDGSLMTTYNSFRKYSEVDPLILIQIKQLELGIAHELSIVEVELLRIYLNIVNLSGGMDANVNRNYLSNAVSLQYLNGLRNSRNNN